MRYAAIVITLLILAAPAAPQEEDWASAPGLKIGEKTLTRAEVGRRFVNVFGRNLARSRIARLQLGSAIEAKGLEVDPAEVKKELDLILAELQKRGPDIEETLRGLGLTRATPERDAWNGVAARALAKVVGIAPTEVRRYLALNYAPKVSGDLADPVYATVGDETLTVRTLFEEILPLTDAGARNRFLDGVRRAVAVEITIKRLGQEPTEEELRELENQDRARVRERSDGRTTFEQHLAQQRLSLALYRNGLRHSERLRRAILGDLRESRGEEGAEEALRNHFERWKDFFSGRRVKASHILFKPKTPTNLDWQKARERADGVRALAVRGEDFGDLAMRHSDDPGSQMRRGDLGFFPRKGGLVEEVARAAFSLEKGQISEPVRTQFGWHVLLVTEIREGKDVTFEAVRTAVERDYAQASNELWSSEQEDKVEIEVLWDALKIREGD